MKHKLEIRQMFDETFKRMVVEEYLSTGCSKMGLLKKYDIHFKSAVQTWMKKLGYTDIHAAQNRTFVRINRMPVPPTKKSIRPEDDLQKRIKELERQLEDEKLRSEAYVRIIEKAEKELNIPIRKKPNTK
jgi:transposase-like protein